jgi:hypothetical protein
MNLSLCDSVELALSCHDELSVEQKNHLAGCQACQLHQRETAAVLTAARLPASGSLSPAAIDSAIQRSLGGRTSAFAALAKYALAAGLGAVLTAAVLRQPPVAVNATPIQIAEGEAEDDFDDAELGWFDEVDDDGDDEGAL